MGDAITWGLWGVLRYLRPCAVLSTAAHPRVPGLRDHAGPGGARWGLDPDLGKQVRHWGPALLLGLVGQGGKAAVTPCLVCATSVNVTSALWTWASCAVYVCPVPLEWPLCCPGWGLHCMCACVDSGSALGDADPVQV